MPYPALPPELPQIISIAAAETTDCSKLPPAAESSHGSEQSNLRKLSSTTRISPESSRSALPVFSSDKSASGKTVEIEPFSPSSSHLSASCATLLGNDTARGYLSVRDKGPNQAGTPAASGTSTESSQPSSIEPLKPQPLKPVFKLRGVASPETVSPSGNAGKLVQQSSKEASPQSIAAPSNGQASQSSSYAISGVSGRLAKTSETVLMDNLNQAIVFEGLTETYRALESLTAEDLARLAKFKTTKVPTTSVAQFNQPTPNNPLVNPFPPGEGRFNPSPVEPPSTQPSPLSPEADTVPEQPISAPVASPTNVIEVTADRQEYNERQQVFTAEGKVLMRFQGALLDADRVQVNLVNRLAVAEGNVALTRGNQVLRGQRFEYNFVQGVGSVQNARGEIFLPSTDVDAAFSTEAGTGDQTILARPLSDRIISQQPQQNVSSPGGVSTSIGAGRNVGRVPGALPRGGVLRRLRFEAEVIDFTPEGWEAQNIDITNDPFSPPELVLRADRATLRRISPLQDEVVATRPRLVFDQRVSVPLLRRRIVLDRTEREPSYFRFGIDGEDRGGLFLEGIFDVVSSPTITFSIYPQVFLQRMIVGDNSDGITDLDNFGVRARLGVLLSPSTTLNARIALNSLDFGKIDSQLRASARLQQVIPLSWGAHRLAFEYSFRDRLFNGSLGFQTIQTSIGALFISPDIQLGRSGVFLNYQTGLQSITADTDRLSLLEPIRDDNRVTLGRFQTTASVSRSFTLWQGQPLPATRNEGLNYTPNPIVPYLAIGTSLRGVFSSYTNGDTQEDLIGTVSLSGQFGHFSRPFFDYTSFLVSYSQVIGRGESPFLFDRTVDERVLSLSFFQQVYGPLRVGIQTSLNLDTRNEISTDYFVEYSRRTHGVIFRYNPVLEIGSISFRVSDFNWTGTAEPFAGSDVSPVEGGVRRRF